jgi:hypothetical protein
VEPASRELVIDAGRAAVASEHLSKSTGGESPFVQRDAADTQRILEILPGAGTIAVERNRETVDAELGHLGRPCQ